MSANALKFQLLTYGCQMNEYDSELVASIPIGRGWGGSIVGLSNVDGFNASENETTKVMSFKDEQWYTVHLRVTSEKIEATIDGDLVVEQTREGHTFTIYDELQPIRPLGFFSWMTTAALRGIRVKRLWPE